MRCYYMSGAGNDFVVIDGRNCTEDYETLSKTLCARMGADGFMALDVSEQADFRLHFYNADGSRGEMCGNGSRCICKFAYDLGIAGPHMTVQTDAGIVEGWRINENRYRVCLTRPTDIDLQAKDGVAYAVCGVPHALVEKPDLQWDQKELLREEAKALRFDPLFPKGTNVDFYRFLDEKTLRILSYERGVEDYTLACGTGCGALTAMLYTAGKMRTNTLTIHNPGGTLEVTAEGNGGLISRLLLEGPAELISAFDI